MLMQSPLTCLMGFLNKVYILEKLLDGSQKNTNFLSVPLIKKVHTGIKAAGDSNCP